jgi:hypothetical protein
MRNGLFKSKYGHKFYYVNGKLHREDGPAAEWADGPKFWLIRDRHHRLDGPAIEYADGAKLWYFHGKRIDCDSQEEFEEQIKLVMFW